MKNRNSTDNDTSLVCHGVNCTVYYVSTASYYKKNICVYINNLVRVWLLDSYAIVLVCLNICTHVSF